MDLDKIKKRKGRLSGFITGLISSALGLHYALVVGLMATADPQTLGFSSFDSQSILILCTTALLLSVINLVGAVLIRSIRLIGGALMLFACVPLFSLAVLEPLSYSFFFLTAVAGLTSAILAFIPYSDRYLSDLRYKKQYMKEFPAKRQTAQQQYYNQQYQPAANVQVQRPGCIDEVITYNEKEDW